MSKKRLLAIILTLVMVLSLVPQSIFAKAGEAPKSSKEVNANGDGTYKIELSVTGDADTDVQTAANVNVLIVYDVSSSMTSNYVTTNPNRSRADYAEDVVHNFIEGLAGYQKADDPNTTEDESDNIQVAVVTFGPNASGRQTWTSDLSSGTNGVNRFFDKEVDGTVTTSHNYGQNNGTNWQAALNQALTYLRDADGDPTFVMLITDGACTAASGETTIAPSNQRPWTDYQPYYDKAKLVAIQVEAFDTVLKTYDASTEDYNDNTTLFGIYAYGTEADLLDDLIYYANNGSDSPDIGGGHLDTENYFNANDTEALKAAVESVFGKIVKALGISAVAIEDGTTSAVSVGSGEVAALVEVIGNYQYWLSIPVTASEDGYQFERDSLATGEAVTYTVKDNGDGTCTVTWPGGPEGGVTENGSVSLGTFKYEWTGSDALYDAVPPEAELNGASVDWVFPDDFVLLSGVTYSITFDVYPTQTTLDYIADLKNDPNAPLPGDVEQYIDRETYSFKTNTGAKISWVDTRPGGINGNDVEIKYEGSQEASAVETLVVTKAWDNQIDYRDQPEVTLWVTRDNEKVYKVTLGERTDPEDENSERDWDETVYISIGIIRSTGTDTYEVMESAAGHDFTFVEEPGESGITYYWELNVPTVRPMMIDGTPTMLIKSDEEKFPVPDGATTYKIDGATYYVDDEAVALTAVNERRSRVFVSKAVEGEGAPEDAEFTFTLNVVNPKAPDEAPTEEEDPKHDSDWWIWYSFWDANETPITEGVEGAVSAGGGWWYAPTGSDVTVTAHAGCSFMINNVPTGTTYTITEEMDPTFVFTSSELTIEGEGKDTTFSGGKTTTGTVQSTNSEYYVKFTNTYEVVDVTVDKVWDDNSDSNGKRPETLTLTLNGAPEGFEVPDPEITKSEDGNTWTYTWSKLPQYDSEGEEIEYTVTEEKIPTGYESDNTTAAPDGSITNVFPLGNLKITKTIEGLPEGEVPADLVFTVTGPEGSDYEEEVAFSDFKEGDDGSYTYTIEGLLLGEYTVEESDADYPNYTLETAAADMTKKATVERDKTAEVSFTNTYTVDKGDLIITKTIEGLPDDAELKDLVFTVTGPEGSDYEEEFEFADFEKDDKGVYSLIIEDLVAGKYTVEETGTDYPDYTLAEDTKTKIEATVPKDAAATAAFTNTYTRTTKEIEVTKVWADDDDAYGLRPDSVDFIITGSDGETYDAELKGEGKTWTAKVEVNATENGEDITYMVDEREVTAGYAKEISNEKLTITNTFEPIKGDPPVQKILEGDKPAKDATFEFTLTAKSFEPLEGRTDDLTGKLPMPDDDSFKAQKKTVKITGEGKEEFGIMYFSVPGTYTYTIIEEEGSEEGYTYDDTVHTIVYKVTVDEKTNALKCEKTVDGGDPIDGMENDEANVSKFSFTNEYTKPVVSVKVTKVWEDGDNANETRPESVTIKLLAGGKDAGKELVISANSEWKGEFSGLDKYDADGKAIAYTVEEVVPEGYTAKVTGDAENGFTVTNTEETPDTGDHSDIALWSTSMLASMLGIVLLGLIKRKKPAKHSR